MWPGVPRIKLNSDGAVEKTEVRISDRSSGPLRLDRLYVLPAPEDPDGRGVSRLRGTRAFEAAVDSTFRPHVVAPMGRTAAHFEHCQALSTSVAVFSLGWRRGPEHVMAECARLEAHVLDRGADET